MCGRFVIAYSSTGSTTPNSTRGSFGRTEEGIFGALLGYKETGLLQRHPWYSQAQLSGLSREHVIVGIQIYDPWLFEMEIYYPRDDFQQVNSNLWPQLSLLQRFVLVNKGVKICKKFKNNKYFYTFYRDMYIMCIDKLGLSQFKISNDLYRQIFGRSLYRLRIYRSLTKDW